ncbi:hypothetical protein KFU94_17390 [Chloroflexi bacterium TSY]|nr:hypothetical protein [Chloroflexi bacterium TSY]
MIEDVLISVGIIYRSWIQERLAQDCASRFYIGVELFLESLEEDGGVIAEPMRVFLTEHGGGSELGLHF